MPPDTNNPTTEKPEPQPSIDPIPSSTTPAHQTLSDQSPPPTNKSPLFSILIAILILAILGTTGYFTYTSYFTNPAPVPILTRQPTPTPESTPTPPEPIPNWQTYTSQDYGFSFKHPPEYMLFDSTNSNISMQIITNNQQTKTTVLEINDSYSINFEDYPSCNQPNGEILPCVDPQSDINIGNKEATRFQVTNAATEYGNYEIIQIQNEPTLEIKIDRSQRRYISQILATFQFTEPEQATLIDLNNWTTFTNTELGFSFDYPTAWGTIEEEIIDLGDNEPDNKGKMYGLTFSDFSNTGIYTSPYGAFAGGRSADFSQGRGGWVTDFKGDPDQPAGVNSYISVGQPGCFTMGAIPEFQGVIEFNLPQQSISGVRLMIPILTFDSIEQYQLKYQQGISEITNDSNDGYDCHTQKSNQVADQMIQDIESQINMDPVSKQYLEIYNRIKNSAQVL